MEQPTTGSRLLGDDVFFPVVDDNNPPPVVVVVLVAQQPKRVSSSFEQVLIDFEVKYGRDASVREVAHWNNTISRA